MCIQKVARSYNLAFLTDIDDNNEVKLYSG